MKFEVGSMTCGHCVKRVTEAIKGRDAQARVAVDLAGRSVTVEGSLAAGDVVAALAAAGYPAVPVATEAAPSERAGAGCCGGYRA